LIHTFLTPFPAFPQWGRSKTTIPLRGTGKGVFLIGLTYKVKKKAVGRNPAAFNNDGKYMD